MVAVVVPPSVVVDCKGEEVRVSLVGLEGADVDVGVVGVAEVVGVDEGVVEVGEVGVGVDVGVVGVAAVQGESVGNVNQ